MFAAYLDVGDQVDQLAEPLLVERFTRVVLRQDIPERRVVALDRGHGVVHELTDSGLSRLVLQMRPASLGRHPEDALGSVDVEVFRIIDAFSLRRRAELFEGVRDVLEEDQAEHHMLVFGRVHAAAQRVGHLPELLLIARCGAVGVGVLGHVGLPAFPRYQEVV